MTAPEQALWLRLTLVSDAAFGRGDGVAGVVDAEVQHDEFGLPYLHGKTLKSILTAECAEVLYSLALINGGSPTAGWLEAAGFLFGAPGSRPREAGRMRVGHAHLPDDLRGALREEFRALQRLNATERARHHGRMRSANLESLTAVRWQTAMDPATGAPLEHSLRSTRVVLRQTPLQSLLEFSAPLPHDRVKWLLAACVRAFHRAGSSRNRGLGRVSAELYEQGSAEPLTPAWLQAFEEEVAG